MIFKCVDFNTAVNFVKKKKSILLLKSFKIHLKIFIDPIILQFSNFFYLLEFCLFNKVYLNCKTNIYFLCLRKFSICVRTQFLKQEYLRI